MATSGPGATNLVTCLADAKMDCVPLVAITGQVGTPVIGTDAFQETPIVEVCRGITKHHYLVTDVEDIARVMREAFHIATTGRPGPVLVDVPKDVQKAQIVPDYDAPMNLPGYHVEDRRATPEQIAQVAAAIKRARAADHLRRRRRHRRRRQRRAARAASARPASPSPMTVHGPGRASRATIRSALDMLGMHGTVYANYAVNEADLLLALGVRFDDRVTGKVAEFAKHGKIVHIDIDPSEINKNKAAHIPIVSDVKYALAELNKIVEPPAADLDAVARADRRVEAKRAVPLRHDDDGILPQYAIDELSRLTGGPRTRSSPPASASIRCGRRSSTSSSSRGRWLTSAGLGTMGFGLPAAMGAKAAHPDKLVVDIDGDGSFLMNIQELATCFCEKLPVKVLLLNNQHLGMVVQWEDRFHARQPGPHLPRPDRPSRGDRRGRRLRHRRALSRLRRDRQGLRLRRPAREEESRS